jgi:hypothetical protein
MPALDECHNEVVHALQKAGWQVNSVPQAIRDIDKRLVVFIDINAEINSNGSQGREIYVEVKCFPGNNKKQELHIALGQYIFYRAILRRKQFQTALYLAIPHTIYQNVFKDAVKQTCQDNDIKLLIVDMEREEIVSWIR